MQAIVYKDDLGQEFDVGEIPAELAEQAHEYHHQLIDAISHFDDEVLEAYIEDESSVTPDQIKRALRAGTLADEITPVLLGSRLQEQGRPAAARRGHRLPAEPARRAAGPRASTRRPRPRPSGRPSIDAPFSALAFKVMSDPYVGKLTYFRVYSGKLKAGDRVLNTSTGKTERVGRILQMHANHREEREEIGAGEIAAGVGLKDDDDRRHARRSRRAPIVLESMTFPEPVISVAVEPKSKADQDKLGTGLARLAEEDPTFRVTTDEETGQTLIAGMGELHLEIIVDRLKREFNVDANVGRPQVAYRETISQPGREDPGPVRPPDRRLGPVRRRRHQPVPAGAGRRLRVRRQDRRRQDPEGVHPGRSTRASRRRWARASSPATRSSTSRSSSSTAATTRSTRASAPSRSPARWPSRRR